MRTGRIAALSLACLLDCAHATATPQTPERLLVDGHDHDLLVTPLEDYWRAGHARPDIFGTGVTSTAHWRGYVATWSISEGQLFLVSVRKEFAKEHAESEFDREWREIAIGDIIPEGTSPLLASWYSGVLRVGIGRPFWTGSIGFQAAYEHELEITVVEGKVRGRKEIVRQKPNLKGSKEGEQARPSNAG